MVRKFLCLVNHDNTCISGLPEDMQKPIMNKPFYSLLYFKVKKLLFWIKLKYTFVLGQLNLKEERQDNKIAGLSS